MRRIYILREVEEDGRILDVLPPEGLDPSQVVNPMCPRCGSATLLAYAEDDDYRLLTWFCLTEDDEEAEPDAWFLVCQNMLCPYEEQVQRVTDPEEAELFDLEQSHYTLDDEIGLTDRNPAGMKELIAYLEKVRKARPHRKMDELLWEARWRCDDGIEKVRSWMKRIPPGRKISFYVDGQEIKGTFIAATDEVLLLRTLPDGEMLGVNAEELSFYGPRRFDPEGDPPDIETLLDDPDQWIAPSGSPEYVVVRGYHLILSEVDRFGQYHVSTSDPEAGAALGLEQRSEAYWTGILRRADMEARYSTRQIVKVKGYWVDLDGETAKSHSPSVHTEDPEVAVALGLTAVKPFWWDEEMQGREPPITRWSGVIPPDQVEDRDEVVVYQWPIPEAKAPGPEGEGS